MTLEPPCSDRVPTPLASRPMKTERLALTETELPESRVIKPVPLRPTVIEPPTDPKLWIVEPPLRATTPEPPEK